MKTIYTTIFIIILSWITVSCTSDNDSATPVVGEVEIYLLESFETEGYTNQIVESTVVCKDQAFLTYNQLLSYNSSTYTFSIVDEAKSLFALQDTMVHFQAFAVKANNDLIYTGYFWPEYSSQIVNWIVASPLLAETYGTLKMELGYPVSVVDEPIPDNRNDNRIINIFRRDNKLAE